MGAAETTDDFKMTAECGDCGAAFESWGKALIVQSMTLGRVLCESCRAAARVKAAEDWAVLGG